MRNNLPAPRPWHEWQARSQAKRQLLLDFLASGEVFTTVEIAATVTGTSTRRALDLLKSMQGEGTIIKDTLDGTPLRPVYGITATGIAYSTLPEVGRHHEPGRLTPIFIQHELDAQTARIQAQAAGFTDWTPARLLHGQGWKKIPDAVCTTPAGRKLGIEVERTIKTPQRLREIIPASLRNVRQGHYDLIVYLSPQGRADAIERALHRVDAVRAAGQQIVLTDAHFQKFRFLNLCDFPAPDL